MIHNFDIAVIGAGPSGMMAGISAKNASDTVCILEKNSSAGKKLLISGKGRCNVTTSKEISEIVSAFGKKGKFLYGVLTRFSNTDVINFFESRGVMLKEERGMRMFPVSDKSETILNCLLNELNKIGVEIFYDFPIDKVRNIGSFFYIISGNRTIKCSKLIIATGGKSYPETGSTGDGYVFARSLGHSIIAPIPALTPLISNNKDIYSLAGLSLKNIGLSFLVKDQVILREFGEMLYPQGDIGSDRTKIIKGGL